MDLSSNELMEDGTSVGDVEMDASAGRISDAYVGSGVPLTISMDGGRVLARAGDADGGAICDDAGRPVGFSSRFKSEDMSGRSNKVLSSSLMVCFLFIVAVCAAPPSPSLQSRWSTFFVPGSHVYTISKRDTLLDGHADEAR